MSAASFPLGHQRAADWCFLGAIRMEGSPLPALSTTADVHDLGRNGCDLDPYGRRRDKPYGRPVAMVAGLCHDRAGRNARSVHFATADAAAHRAGRSRIRLPDPRLSSLQLGIRNLRRDTALQRHLVTDDPVAVSDRRRIKTFEAYKDQHLDVRPGDSGQRAGGRF